MEYSWNKTDIEECIDQIFYKSRKKSKDVSYYLKVINYVNCVLKTMELPEIYRTITRKEKLHKVIQEYYLNERYYDLIETFNEIQKRHEEEFNITIDSFIKLIEEEPTIYIQNEDALTIMHDFFKETDEEFFKYFLELYKNRHKLIKFTKKEDIENMYRNGSCLFIDIVRKNFINVKDSNGISKLIILAHEIGHAIANLYRPKQMYNSKDNFLDEVESLFFELAFTNDIAKKIDSLEAAKEAFLTLCEFSEYAENLSMHKTIITCWKENNYELNKAYYNNLKNKKIQNRMFIDSLNTSIEEEGSYITSYITALNLLGIYKQDKKEALNILKKIISMRTSDSYQVINKFFKEFGNTETETLLIQKNMNDELKKTLIKK